MKKITLVIFICSFLIFLIFSRIALAQSTAQIIRIVAVAYDSNAEDIKDGSIISLSEQGAILSHLAYDSQVLGIVSRNIAITLFPKDRHQGVPIIVNGRVNVLVSTRSGAIKKGDQITTSTIPGVGVKALRSGYVLGTALEDYDKPDGTNIDTIAVDMNLHYFNAPVTDSSLNSLADILKRIMFVFNQGPPTASEYLVIVFVILASIVLAFLTFGRTTIKEIKILRNNPIIIHQIIILNVIMLCLMILSCLSIAFFLLRF